MFSKIIRPAVVVLTLIPAAAVAELPTLTVKVNGADPATGVVEISVFDSAENFFKAAFLQNSCKPSEDGSCSVEFAAVNEGDYAVVAVHDANDNKKLDNGFMGFGAERFGYSNDASNPLFGRASFDDAKFKVSESTEIEIKLD